MIFNEVKIIKVFGWDLSTKIFTDSRQFKTEKGLSLPAGLTTDEVVQVKGKVAIRDTGRDQWVHVDDDRGRVFYDKQNGQAFETTILNEEVDRRRYTKIEPPTLKDGQLVRFVDSSQNWEIGFDWYEMPIWDSQQNMTYYTGDFFVPNEHFTNVEPMPRESGFILDSEGNWIEPPEQPVTTQEQ